MTLPRLTIIIPTWNENAHLPGLLAQLRAQVGVTMEILVADGGSRDGTRETTQRAGAHLIQAAPGRGAQMNAAARRAKGAELLFLHADSGLSDPCLLQQALAALDRFRATRGYRCAGHFKLRFVEQPPGHEGLFHYYAEKSALNRRECFNGDQGLLLSRIFFAELGGFSEEFPFLEDQQLGVQIIRLGHWLTLPGILETSARRFAQEGVARRILLNGLIMACFHTEFREFPRQAPALYRSQDKNDRLRLAPFFRLVWRLNRT
ncbi:MAG: TIGR04283 family arsenosugar biosynthesis glycosyltransferase, partial [Magnetococcales bacterium]|nr:TIGR04283 family arsenosugar biosynthesis glycosyltransferase [Magnetococcales bacterium]